MKNLQEEIASGVSRIYLDEQGNPIRKVKVACIVACIYVVDPRHNKLLKEVKQVFKSGETRERDIWGVAGKIENEESESPRNAGVRELQEELGLQIAGDRLIYCSSFREKKISSSYGQETEYVYFNFILLITPDEWQAKWATEEKDKVIYFAWYSLEEFYGDQCIQRLDDEEEVFDVDVRCGGAWCAGSTADEVERDSVINRFGFDAVLEAERRHELYTEIYTKITEITEAITN